MSTDHHLSRRDFIQRSGLVGAGITAAQFLPLRFLQAQQAVEDVANPLAHYPNRDWEKLYRNHTPMTTRSRGSAPRTTRTIAASPRTSATA